MILAWSAIDNLNIKRFQDCFSNWTFTCVCRLWGLSPGTPAYVSLIQRQSPPLESITPVSDRNSEVFSWRRTSPFAERQRVPHQLTAPVPPLSYLKVTVSLGVSVTLCVFVCPTYQQLWGRYICWVPLCCGCCAGVEALVQMARKLNYSVGTVLVRDKQRERQHQLVFITVSLKK